MIHNILHNRILLLMVIIIHLLAGFSYGHADMAEEGEIMSPAGKLYLDNQDAETPCHDEQQDQALASPDVDCAAQCLACCGHGPCGLLAIVSPLDMRLSGSEPITLQFFTKAIYLLVEPRPPRSLRHYA